MISQENGKMYKFLRLFYNNVILAPRNAMILSHYFFTSSYNKYYPKRKRLRYQKF